MLKILGTGDIKEKIILKADLISKSAKEKLEKIGGSVQLKKNKINIWVQHLNLAILKNRIIFTIFILHVYRFGTFVPLPGIDPEQLTNINGR